MECNRRHFFNRIGSSTKRMSAPSLANASARAKSLVQDVAPGARLVGQDQDVRGFRGFNWQVNTFDSLGTTNKRSFALV